MTETCYPHLCFYWNRTRFDEGLLLILAAAGHTELISCLEIASSHILSKANGHEVYVKAASPRKNFPQIPLYYFFVSFNPSTVLKFHVPNHLFCLRFQYKNSHNYPLWFQCNIVTFGHFCNATTLGPYHSCIINKHKFDCAHLRSSIRAWEKLTSLSCWWRSLRSLWDVAKYI